MASPEGQTLHSIFFEKDFLESVMLRDLSFIFPPQAE